MPLGRAARPRASWIGLPQRDTAAWAMCAARLRPESTAIAAAAGRHGASQCARVAGSSPHSKLLPATCAHRE
eukprot:scaffold16556_cov133-Isochrysis_galbana.AAC.4